MTKTQFEPSIRFRFSLPRSCADWYKAQAQGKTTSQAVRSALVELWLREQGADINISKERIK